MLFNTSVDINIIWNKLTEDKRKYWTFKYMSENDIKSISDFDRGLFIDWFCNKITDYLNSQLL